MSTATKNPPAKSGARGLGKGLSALMSESYSQVAEPVREKPMAKGEGTSAMLSVEDIKPGKYQPRGHFDQRALLELSESIRRNGVVQPIIVREASGGKYEIIAGERRWRAANMAGQRTIPAIIRQMDDRKMMEIALVENVQRQDLNPLEEAAGYDRLMLEFSYTQEELATTVHKSRSHIANLLRLLELPEDIRNLLAENKISMGHARALAGVPNASALAEEVVQKGLNVRQVEKLARLGKGGDGAPKARKSKESQPPEQAQASQPTSQPQQSGHYAGPRDPDIMALEETLSENLGLKVSINDRGQSGDIMIAYHSLDQLDDILRRLGGSI